MGVFAGDVYCVGLVCCSRLLCFDDRRDHCTFPEGFHCSRISVIRTNYKDKSVLITEPSRKRKTVCIELGALFYANFNRFIVQFIRLVLEKLMIVHSDFGTGGLDIDN